MSLSRRLLAIAVCLFTAMPSRADPFTSLSFFGDSLTDEGRAGRTAPIIWSEVLRSDLSVTTGRNYAIGGATSGNQASAAFGNSGFLGQVNSFVATPATDSSAAAGVWIGTNDIGIGSATHVAPSVIASTTIENVRTGLTELGTNGIHTVVLLGVYDLSMENAFKLVGVDSVDVRDTAASASQLYNSQLASLAVSGVKIQYFDVANFINHLQINAAAYGFTQILPLQPGQTCNAACEQTSIFSDTIHLTARAQALLGDYVASGNPIYNSATFTYGALADNVASAAGLAGAQTQLARGAAEQFSRSLFDRLDAIRDLPYAGTGGGGVTGRYAGAPGPWTIYAYGGASGGTLAHVGSSLNAQGNLDATVANVTGGVEYRVSPTLRFGAAFNYAHGDSEFGRLGFRDRIDSVQGALYASANYANLFLDGIATGGGVFLDDRRSGTFGQANATPRGDIVTVAGRAGYLVPAGPIRIGPIGELDYSHVRIDAYRETGGFLYAVGYGGAASDSVYAGAGVEVRLTEPILTGFNPFITATYNRQLDRGATLVSTYLANLPTQSLGSNELYAGRDFVKVAAGSTFAFGPQLYGTVTAFGLKGEQNLYAVGGNVGLAYHY